MKTATLVWRRIFVLSWSLFFLTGSISADVPLPAYSIRNLGTLSGLPISAANGMNDKGEVVGHASNEGFSKNRPFLISPPYTTLINLVSFDNDPIAAAQDVNHQGVVVGYTRSDGEVYAGCLWSNGVLAGGSKAVVSTINNSGKCVGYTEISSPYQEKATVWTLNVYEGVTRAFLLTPVTPTSDFADWDFTTGQWGWTAATSIPPFADAEAHWVPGIGYGVRAKGFPSFAFLQSPELTLQEGRTYRLWCTIATTATTMETAPQIRLRAFHTVTNMSELLSLDSVSFALPSYSSRTYEFTITTQMACMPQTFRFYLDYTFFNPDDEQDAWVYLQRVILAEE